MDNYQIARDRAQEYFLQFDQNAIIKRWHLLHDENFLYVEFLGRPYAVCRSTGRIDRLFDRKQAGFSEVLSIFDFLCYEGSDQFLTGRFAPVNSLRGRPVTAGVETGFYVKTAKYFEENIDAYDPKVLFVFLEKIANSYVNTDVILNDDMEGKIVMINKYALGRPGVLVGGAYVDLAHQGNMTITALK